MIVNGHDLGPMIPVARGSTKTGISGKALSGYRATRHFVMWAYPGGNWAVSNCHGVTTQFYPGPEEALEMAEYMEDQEVDWNAIRGGWQVPSLVNVRLQHKHAELRAY